MDIIGQGATTTIYRDGDKALKLYANAPHDEADNEALRQRFAYGTGLPVPAVYGVRRLGDKAVVLEMEYIDGHPIMRHGMGEDESRDAIDILVRLQCDVHKVCARGLPKQTDRIARKIKDTPHLDDPMKGKLLSLLTRLDDGRDCLCHGDFHPLNIIFDGSRHWIIDWVDATSGSPLADACRTYLIFMQHISPLADDYLRLFCKETGMEQEDALAWLPVIAAARLGENMDGKSRKTLLEILQKSLEA